MGFGKFWTVMEIRNAISQDLKSFGKEKGFSKWLWKVLVFYFAKILKYPKMDVV